MPLVVPAGQVTVSLNGGAATATAAGGAGWSADTVGVGTLINSGLITTPTGLNSGNASNLGSTSSFNGKVCEVILCAVEHSRRVREHVEGYLAWKWGLQASLPAAHRYSTARVNAAPKGANAHWTPLLGLRGMVGWWDGGDAAQLLVSGGGGATTNGQALLSWKDKSGWANHLTAYSGSTGTAPSYASSSSPFLSAAVTSVNVTGGGCFLSTSLLTTTMGQRLTGPYTLFVVAQNASSNTGANQLVSVLDSAQTSTLAAWQAPGSATLLGHPALTTTAGLSPYAICTQRGGASPFASPMVPSPPSSSFFAAGSQFVATATQDAGFSASVRAWVGGAACRMQSVAQPQTAAAGALSATFVVLGGQGFAGSFAAPTGAGTAVGGSNIPSSTAAWNGYVGEIILCAAALSPQEIARVEAYLANRWMAATTLDGAHVGAAGHVFA